ncbi:hypothetical protein J3E72DRAFT_378289 [Bipolaris maydis]|nr:hypothetical protein J3E72DRAFT_378289 [Bipolaris maydis]
MNDLFGRESSFGDEIFEEPVICSPMTQAELDNSISFEGLAESTTIKLVAPSEENREDKVGKTTATTTKVTLVVFKVNLESHTKSSGAGKNKAIQSACIQVEFHSTRPDTDTVEAQRPVVQTSSRSLHENLEAGVTKAKGTVGGTASKTREWSKSYFDVNRSQPVSFLESDGKSSNFNGVKWNMEHNHLAGDGVKLELLLYLLLTRQDDSKYAVKITAEVDTAKLFGHKEHKCVIRAIPKELGHTEPAVSYLQGKKMWQKLDVNHFEALLSPDMDTSLKLPWDLEEMAGTKNEDVQDGHEEDDSGEEEVEGENDDAAAVSWTEEQAEHSAEGKSARTAKRRDVTTPLEDSAAILDALLRLSAAEGGSNSYGQEEDTPTRIAMLESSQSIWPRVIRRGRVKRRDATIPLDKSAAKLDTLHGMSERATVPTFSAQAYFMEAKLKTAIGKWRNPSYKDNIEFQKELEPLYRSLVATTHNTLGQEHGQQLIKNSLEEDSELMDRCQWDDAIAEFTKLVLLNNKQFHRNIIDHRTTAHLAFNYALCEIPTILQGDKKDRSQDQELLDGVIKYTYLNLAIAILASKYHCNQLTMREHVVKAMDNWISKKDEQSQRALLSGNDHNQDDDNPSDYNDDDENIDDNDQLHDDGVGDDEENCRKLVIQVLSHTPEDVLRSPEVLTKVMQHNLLNDADILKAYAKVAKDDIKTSKVPFASFKPVASLLKDVPGILHMAVFYQQQPLVETLLRCNAQLAVIRAYKVQNADSGFYPLWFNNKVKREANSDEQNRMWKEIRSALIYCVMKHAENVQTLLNALRESGEPENEINFDMSRLLIEGTNVADFVKLMPQQKRSYNLIRYEETIR